MWNQYNTKPKEKNVGYMAYYIPTVWKSGVTRPPPICTHGDDNVIFTSYGLIKLACKREWASAIETEKQTPKKSFLEDCELSYVHRRTQRYTPWWWWWWFNKKSSCFLILYICSKLQKFCFSFHHHFTCMFFAYHFMMSRMPYFSWRCI